MKDKKIEELIYLETKRQENSLNLIASENFESNDVREATGSILSNKYSEGYPGKRYYPGNKYYDEIENIAKERAIKAFDVNREDWDVNVQPYSGSPANIAIYLALTNPGEKIMGMSLFSGGHLTHGHNVSASGKIWDSVQYEVDKDSGRIDYEKVYKIGKKEKPKVLVSGFTAYPRKIDFKRFGEIAKEINAYHVSDISHIAGLVVGGVHQSPFPYADIVITTTHKTLRGPRGAIIFSRKEISEKIDKAVFPGMQGGPHNNITAAKAIAFLEASQPEFKKYAQQIVKNAKTLADELKNKGCKLVSGGTDTHLILLDVRSFNVDGKTAEEILENVGIIANRNSIPGDKSSLKPSGLRLGTSALTTRGMKEEQMIEIAYLICKALENKDGVKEDVSRLCNNFPILNK